MELLSILHWIFTPLNRCCFIRTRFDKTYGSHSLPIKYVRMKHEAEQIIADHQKDSQHLSSAEKLLNKFTNLVSCGEEIYYCALILDCRGEYLVRMPPGRPRKICKDAGDTTNAATSTTNCEFHVLNFQFVILIKKM